MLVEEVSHESQEITSQFVSDLTEEDIRGVLVAVVKVASLMDQVLREGGMSRWSIKGMVDSSICKREIACVIIRIPYRLVPEAMVEQRIYEYVEVVFPNRMLSMIQRGIMIEGMNYEVRVWTTEIKSKGEAAVPSKDFFFFFFIQVTPHTTGCHGRGTQESWVPGSSYVHEKYYRKQKSHLHTLPPTNTRSR